MAVTLTKSLQDTITKKDAQIEDLQVRVVSLEERCDDLEQYSRRNTVRIRGLAESANEVTDGSSRTSLPISSTSRSVPATWCVPIAWEGRRRTVRHRAI